MSSADELVKLIFSWIKQRESCALKLKKLADELEKRRRNFNAVECVGSSVAVAGAGCVIAAGAAVLFTGGAAAPLLAGLGATYGGVGGAINGISKFTEWFMESYTLKEAERIEKRSDDIAKNIQQLYEVLRRDVKRQNPKANAEDLDQLVITDILEAVAKCNGMNYHPGKGFSSYEANDLHSNKQFWLAAVLTVAVLAAVGVTVWYANKLWVTVERTVFGGVKTVLGGTVALITALPMAIDSWMKLIAKDHVTEASRSIRGTAEEILRSCREWREKLDNIRRNLQEISDKQQEAERRRASSRQTWTTHRMILETLRRREEERRRK